MQVQEVVEQLWMMTKEVPVLVENVVHCGVLVQVVVPNLVDWTVVACELVLWECEVQRQVVLMVPAVMVAVVATWKCPREWSPLTVGQESPVRPVEVKVDVLC